MTGRWSGYRTLPYVIWNEATVAPLDDPWMTWFLEGHRVVRFQTVAEKMPKHESILAEIARDLPLTPGLVPPLYATEEPLAQAVAESGVAQ